MEIMTIFIKNDLNNSQKEKEDLNNVLNDFGMHIRGFYVKIATVTFFKFEVLL